MTPRYSLPVGVATAGLLALAPAAEAAMPKFSSKTIVVNKSIGGVKLGAKSAAGKKAWGAGSVCDLSNCFWRVRPQDTSKGDARFVFGEDGKIRTIQIDVIRNAKGKFSFKSPLTAVKTSKNIGIGSKVAALKKAYPKAKDEGGTGNVFTITQGTRLTRFVVDLESKRVTGIALADIG
jgi:hypothetical protein